MQNVSEGTFRVEWRDTSEKDVVSKGTRRLETSSLLYSFFVQLITYMLLL